MSEATEVYRAQRQRFTAEINNWLDNHYANDDEIHVPALAGAFLQQALILLALAIDEEFLTLDEAEGVIDAGKNDLKDLLGRIHKELSDGPAGLH